MPRLCACVCLERQSWAVLIIITHSMGALITLADILIQDFKKESNQRPTPSIQRWSPSIYDMFTRLPSPPTTQTRMFVPLPKHRFCSGSWPHSRHSVRRSISLFNLTQMMSPWLTYSIWDSSVSISCVTCTASQATEFWYYVCWMIGNNNHSFVYLKMTWEIRAQKSYYIHISLVK